MRQDESVRYCWRKLYRSIADGLAFAELASLPQSPKRRLGRRRKSPILPNAMILDYVDTSVIIVIAFCS